MHCMWRIITQQSNCTQASESLLVAALRQLSQVVHERRPHKSSSRMWSKPCMYRGWLQQEIYNSLKEHVQLAHKGAAKCWECDTIFATKAEAESHRSTCLLRRCKRCGGRFLRSEKHSENCPFSHCNRCERKRILPSEWEAHLRVCPRQICPSCHVSIVKSGYMEHIENCDVRQQKLERGLCLRPCCQAQRLDKSSAC